MFGYADIETDSFMPSAITYARAIMDRVYQFAKDNPNKLGVDIKTQVTIDYGNIKRTLKIVSPKRYPQL